MKLPALLSKGGRSFACGRPAHTNTDNTKISQSTMSSSAFTPQPPPLDTFRLDHEDDVSTLHFEESVTDYNHIRRPSVFRPQQKALLSSRSIQFVRSDSLLVQERQQKENLAGNGNTSRATPTMNNTSTQPSHALSTSKLCLSLIPTSSKLSAPNMISQAVERHVYTAIDNSNSNTNQQRQSMQGIIKKSVPVDLDDGSFIDDDDVSVIDDMALRHLEKRNVVGAIEIYSSLIASHRAKQHSHAVAQFWSQLSVLYVLKGNAVKALRCSQQSLRKRPTESQEYVSSLIQVGMMQAHTGSIKKAINSFRTALQLECKLVGYHHASIPLLLNNLACLQFVSNKYGLAALYLQESLALQKHARHTHNNNLLSLFNVGTTLLNLGVVQQHLQDYNAAITHLEEGLLVCESVCEDALYLRKCAETLSRCIQCRASTKQTKSTPILAMHIFGNPDGVPLTTISDTRHLPQIWMGSVVYELSCQDRIRNAVHALIAQEPSTSTSCPSSFPVDCDEQYVLDAELHLEGIHAQVVNHCRKQETSEALELLKLTYKSHRQSYGDMHHLCGTALHNIALVHLYAGQYQDALWHFQEAVQVRVTCLGKDHFHVAASMIMLGLIQMANDDFDTAYTTFLQVLNTRRKVLGYSHVEVANILTLVAHVQYEFGSLLAALKSMEEALEIDEANADILANAGFLYYKAKNTNEAITMFQRALTVFRKKLGESHPKTLVVTENLRRANAPWNSLMAFGGVGHCIGSTVNCSSFEELTEGFLTSPWDDGE